MKNMKKGFTFQNLKGFDRELWDNMVTEAIDAEVELPEEPVMFFGSDLESGSALNTTEVVET